MRLLHLDRALVILKFLYHPFEHYPDGWWSPGFLYDDPYLKRKIIYANDKGPNNIKLLQCFPERKIFLYFGTLEKGMLVPLRVENGKIAYGEPLSLEKPGKKNISLVNDPKKFFKIYSPEFGNFLDNVYKQNDFSEIDVARLNKLGSLFFNKGDYEQASFCFEAALQIEKQPKFRYQILNSLAPCYQKEGKKEDAKKVMRRIVKLKDTELFHILPEKGF
jgi:tetratricopeptide (TPR) repeat protein